MAMSMRSRGAAAVARRSRSGIRPVYEDFKPTSELKHEEGADILLYHLPGFAKEQIRIIAESKGVLRVRGDRLLADNRWSRFQEEVVVPEHCNLNEIRAKFEDGILRILMPKHTSIKSKQQSLEPAAKQPHVTNQSSTHDQTPQSPKDGLTSTSTLPNNSAYTEPQSKDATSLQRNNNVKRGGDNGGNLNVKENQGLIGNVGNQGKNVVNKENESYGLSNMKNLTKGHVLARKMEEDRQVLVNIGVAILVIMGLGATISYSLG